MDSLLAVNGTLMRGLELNGNLLAAGATFVREARTAPVYRLWSIDDRHPAMVRVASGGVAVAIEVWSVPAAGLAGILLAEPPGLSIGKVRLEDGSEVLGVLGEPIRGEQRLTRARRVQRQLRAALHPAHAADHGPYFERALKQDPHAVPAKVAYAEASLQRQERDHGAAESPPRSREDPRGGGGGVRHVPGLISIPADVILPIEALDGRVGHSDERGVQDALTSWRAQPGCLGARRRPGRDPARRRGGPLRSTGGRRAAEARRLSCSPLPDAD